jgi:Binding-protein-dependent transport system inner membrane component
MQAFAEQSNDKPVGILKLRRPHADNHWYLPRRVTGRLLYCKSVFNPLRPLMPIFPINRRVSILFGKIFCLFDSFITQHPRKMRGCLRTPYVMLICLAGLRSIPGYIYEAAEVDRASPWRQFWSITLPMVLPFLMLAILFRAIENFKMFDMVNLLTSGGPGSTTEVASITLKREAFEKWRTGYSSAFAIILFVTVFGAANIYVKALNRVKQR